MSVALLGLDPDSYERHPLHDVKRCWMETNCYVDVWIEVLNALGLEPAAAGAFTLSTDFDDDQWTMFKFPAEDLYRLFGLRVAEMNVWRGVLAHVEEQLALGRLMTVEVDSFYLPDTTGVAYGQAHVKTTIVPAMLDADAHRLGYFHNAGYWELDGDDFEGIFRIDGHLASPDTLPPYVELVRLDRLESNQAQLVETAKCLLVEHLGRRPDDNPILRLAARVDADMPILSSLGLDHFHEYAFGTVRQCGASWELAAAFIDWLGRMTHDEHRSVVDDFERIAAGAKTAELGMARIAAGRHFDLAEVFHDMAECWQHGITNLVVRYGT